MAVSLLTLLFCLCIGFHDVHSADVAGAKHDRILRQAQEKCERTVCSSFKADEGETFHLEIFIRSCLSIYLLFLNFCLWNL